MWQALVPVGSLNLKRLTLEQRSILQTICSRNRAVERLEERPTAARFYEDVKKLLKIMHVPEDF